LKDDHLQYAITWFALAGAVAIAFGVWMRGRRPMQVAEAKR
jgi:cytochrome oxidase assembly protein ShyY1